MSYFDFIRFAASDGRRKLEQQLTEAELKDIKKRFFQHYPRIQEMAKYVQTAQELQQKVEQLGQRFNMTNADIAEVGHIVNLAIRCCPRGVQHTVRKNIVDIVTQGRCNVSMTEVTDPKTGYSYHKIDITPRPTKTVPPGVLAGPDRYATERGSINVDQTDSGSNPTG